jgi:hypothetical protein
MVFASELSVVKGARVVLVTDVGLIVVSIIHEENGSQQSSSSE